MRLAGLTLLALALATAAPAAGTGVQAAAGSFAVDSGRGKVVVQGSGVLVGRLDQGQIEIKDLTPNDRFSPRLNGVPRGKVVTLRGGKDVGFYVPGGRYRVTVRGEGISLSIRGTGVAVLDGAPDTVGVTGVYAVDDGVDAPLPDEPTRVSFGKLPDAPSIEAKKAGDSDRGTTP